MSCFWAAAGMPATLSAIVSIARSWISARIGWHRGVRYSRTARRSSGSLRRSIQPAASIRSMSRATVIGCASRHSASADWFIPSERATLTIARHCACVSPSDWSRRSKLRRSIRATSVISTPRLRSGSNSLLMGVGAGPGN
jgi:hypothetical protein